MELKNKPVQLDMFAREKKEMPRRPSFYERLSLRLVLSLETVIVISIFLSLVVLLAFSFGVEKGKRQVQKELNPPLDIVKQSGGQTLSSDKNDAISPSASRSNVKTIQSGAALFPSKIRARDEWEIKPAGETGGKVSSEKEVTPIISDTPQGRYIIQVASYQKETFARNEETRLKSEGYQTLLRTSGQLYALCVGTFSDRQQAEMVKKKLRAKYQDCFIRRL